MAKQLTDIQKLAMDVYHNVPTTYNNTNGEDAIRNLLVDSIGGTWNYYAFLDNKGKFFQVVSEIIQEPMQETLEGIFDGVTKTETIALGDTKVIEVEDQDLFEVAMISAGNNDVSRQRVFNKQVRVETAKMTVKIYDDFDRFVSGRINFANLIARVKKSFANQVAKKVYDAILSGYNNSASAKWSKTGTFDESALDELIARVEGKTGLKCSIYGTKTALGKVSSSLVTTYKSDNKVDEYLGAGFLQTYKGQTKMIPLVNPVDKNNEFELDTDYLFILPEGQDIVNVVFEGEPVIVENTEAGVRNDQQIEFLYEQNVGVVALVSKYYGIYKLA